MHFLYNLGVRMLGAALWLASFFRPKAKLWIEGRRDWRNRLGSALRETDGKKTLWMHVSSLGEFEQGRPILDQFRTEFPQWRIVLTFFSPSGFEIRKNYANADVVWYLPADTPQNARYFLKRLEPDLAIFVKYDFWANYLFQLPPTPTLLVSALFRPGQPFFKWYGGLWRKMLGCFSHIFVQNQASADLLRKIGMHRVEVAGDTRVDRVISLAAAVQPNTKVELFAGNAPVFVVGSSWEADEALLFPVLKLPEFQHYKIIVAPHEPSESNVARICRQFDSLATYSKFEAKLHAGARVLVIDNVGLLNTLYRYGKIAYIGGGLGKGIHNTLEPAAFGLPIIFGPRFEKFEEARQFVARGGGFPVKGREDLKAVLQQLQQSGFYEAASKAVLGYLTENKGATGKAIEWLKART
jgi:3-deoxy-D-manno-octulosonic-acid transferase